jgi:hypothetical protein
LQKSPCPNYAGAVEAVVVVLNRSSFPASTEIGMIYFYGKLLACHTDYILLLACHTTLYYLPACHTNTEAIQRYLLGTFRALLGRNCNAGDAGDTRTGGCALTSTSESLSLAASIAFAFALACSTKGSNSLSNSELDLPPDIS